ncbi:DUF6221 family protein [Streptomyces prunicolor]|uniref:DUF6221 family protein n=1 Tax=Streptomyces prunicolor TaxID=67348 RepID=UPI00225510E8|nr:DUF6221 family protein [Streptomyces prunicolor]MCX5239805.1 DUF6221 family protein [Streptomyces prunicolor]
MTDTDHLVMWLREAMDAATQRAEAAATETSSAEWEYQERGTLNITSPPGFVVAAVDYLDPAPGKFMADNDPAAVLRRIAANRKLLDDLLGEKHQVVEGDCWYTCAAAAEERDGGETCDDSRLGKPCDCGRDARVARRVLLLAEGWGWSEGEQR